MSIGLGCSIASDKKIESSKQRIHGPDILRGIAALSVIFFHVLYVTGIPYSQINLWITGRFDFFVRIFFMISAFSMAYVYMNKINTIHDMKIFYLKRAFRIAPLFYFVIILNVLIAILTNNPIASSDDFFLNALFVFSLIPGKHGSLVGGGWSIGIEMIFYILFPFFLVIAGNLRSAFISFTLLLITSLLTTKYYGVFLDGKLNAFGKLNILAHAQFFMIGFIIYHAWARFRVNINKSVCGSVFVLSIVAMILSFRLQKSIPEEVFISVIGCVMLYASVLGLPNILDNKVTRYLGMISYSTYLMQFPVISILSWCGAYRYIKLNTVSGIDANLIAGVVTVACVIAISSITYRFIELPFRNYGRNLTS